MKLRSGAVKAAKSTKYTAPVMAFVKRYETPEALLNALEAVYAKDLGVRVIEKPRGRRFGITLRDRVYAPPGFSTWSALRKCEFRGHELVHVYQQRGRGGFAWFATKYLLSRKWRWIYEMQAYRVSRAILEKFGLEVPPGGAWVQKRISSFKKFYRLRGIRNLGTATRDAFREAA